MPSPLPYPYICCTLHRHAGRAERTADDVKLCNWLAYAIESGSSYLENQRAWNDIDTGLDIINGDWFDDNAGELSNVSTNRTKRQIREIVASLGNLKVVTKTTRP